MKIKRKIIEIDPERCDGCGLCVPSCAEGAIQILDGKATLTAEKYCDGLGACLGECPNDALHIIERDAEDFDEHAVEEHLQALKPPAAPQAETKLPCGCPSTTLQTLVPVSSCQEANQPQTQTQGSALSHWPVQIKLVPPTAPFLKKADLLVVSDCAPLAYPAFHRDFLQGKVVMMGCPKFDDVQEYIQKFTDIFSTANINSVTTIVMEVPCCAGLPWIVKQAMEKAGKNIPLAERVIGVRGNLIK
ncbi:MAG: 4Fe-4S binding protein [Deltaproteobacteria bacterium]|nr:4Fe-4S binding protein [Deltaproteobacteria bacterium]